MAHKKMRFIAASRCFLITLILNVLIVGGVRNESIGAPVESERVSKLIEGARSEGKIVWYTAMLVTDSSRMIKRFEEKYPFVKIELYRANSVTLANRIIGESKSKKYIPDVLSLPGFKAAFLKNEHIYASYVSPESQFIPDGYKDPDGHWTGYYAHAYVMAYNTKLLSRKDIPDTFEGFLNPRWKGKKIGFDTKEVEWFANILKIMGEKKGMDFLQKFAAQDLNYRSDRAILRDLVIAGEFPVATAYADQIEERKKDGAPVDWAVVSPVITKFNAIGLTAHASHPNAAKLFIDFCLSKEGQAMIGSFGREPARLDVEANVLKSFKGVKVYPSDMSLVDKYPDYIKKSGEVFISSKIAGRP